MVSGSRKRLYCMTVLSGVVSISSYVFLYTHQEWVTLNFTRGGVYAVFPIATAFYFSFVHGAFTSCLLRVLGFREARSAVAGNKRNGGGSEGEVRSCPPA